MLPVIGINVSESPAIGEKFSRLRDELWWRAREWFEAMNCALPDDEMRGLPSPDVADAFVLTFADAAEFVQYSSPPQ